MSVYSKEKSRDQNKSMSLHLVLESFTATENIDKYSLNRQNLQREIHVKYLVFLSRKNQCLQKILSFM